MRKPNLRGILLCVVLLLGLALALQAQKIVSISPSAGSLAGNTLVTLNTTGISKNNYAGVFFQQVGSSGGIGQLGIDTSQLKKGIITFKTAPAGAPVAYPVYIGLVGGSKSSSSNLTFAYKSPEITSIFPDSSSLTGNDTITIKGRYFSNNKADIAVNFSKAGAKVISSTDTTIVVTNPNRSAAGAVQVSVIIKGVASDTSQATRFTYCAPRSSYRISLHNFTGLEPKYKVYVLGYSTASNKVLTVAPQGSVGSFAAAVTSGFVPSFELGKEISEIEVSSKNPINGARVYFFVADTTKAYSQSRGLTKFERPQFPDEVVKGALKVTQPSNPPQSAYPQYTYLEITFLENQGMYADVSTVDGFYFPLSLIAEDKTGKELDRVGQSANIDGASIVKAYQAFMVALEDGGEPTQAYQSLVYPIDPNLTVLLNPGLYLEDSTSDLETAFDAALNTLFTQPSSQMSIWQNAAGAKPHNYKATAVKNYPFPSTNNQHDALMFVNEVAETLHVYNPVGFSVVSYADPISKKRRPIMGKMTANLLTFQPALPATTPLTVGMYVSDGGGSTDGTTQITKINTTKAGIVSVSLNTSVPYPSVAQYRFAKAPTSYYKSSGEMTFAGSGLFADGPLRYTGTSIQDSIRQVQVNGIENQISTALNRGIALAQGDTATVPGHTTTYWGIETNWYPEKQAQNYFSYFMHTATVGDTNIFSLPTGALKSARGDLMGKAYGFAYDENPIGTANANPVQVPSEFPGSYPEGTTQLRLELGPWK